VSVGECGELGESGGVDRVNIALPSSTKTDQRWVTLSTVDTLTESGYLKSLCSRGC